MIGGEWGVGRVEGTRSGGGRTWRMEGEVGRLGLGSLGVEDG